MHIPARHACPLVSITTRTFNLHAPLRATCLPQVDVMLQDGFPALIDALVAQGGLDIRLDTGEPLGASCSGSAVCIRCAGFLGKF